MFRKWFLIPAILSLGSVLMVADSADAQWRGWSGRRAARNTYVAPYADGYGGNSYSPYSADRYYANPRTLYYPQPSTDYYVPSSQMANNYASIRVIVPDRQARVWFDGNPTQQLGTDRMFYSPPLQAGVSNTYRIRAKWMQGGREMTQERDVSVSPGATAFVDFTQQTSDPQPPRSDLLEGRIVRTAKDHFVIETGDNRQITVYTNPQTRFTIDNREGSFPDLRVGTTVSTGFTVQNDRHLATTVTAVKTKK